MDVNKRIKDIRLALGLTQISFANKLGIRQSSLSAIENGVTETVGERNIRIICKEFNVNEEWLRNGNGEMFKAEENLLALLGNKISGLDETDKKIIGEYLKLSTKQRKVMKEYFKKVF
jgi:transcriptional regulator with XRE-family HTH domain